jgi:hypothetical protein
MDQKYQEYLKKPKTAIFVFIIITILFSYPLYQNLNNWGIHDWDQHLFYEGAARTSILNYHQVPLWNPYQCGGNVLLANPQSSFLSIHFPLTLIVGEVVATKLAILLYLFIGLLGMWYLCRKLDFGPITSYTPPIILFLSGVYAVRMTVGHTNWYYLAFIPWLFLCYLKTKETNRYIIPSSFLLALIFFGGGLHPFVITALILATYATIEAIQKKKVKSIITIFLLLLLFIPFAAIKLVPTLAIQNEMLPIEQTDVQPNTIKTLFTSLTERHPDLTTTFTSNTEQLWQWHEYHAYVGILTLLLSLMGFFLWKQTKTYIIATLIVLILILSQNLFPTLWNLLYKIPFTSLFHGPSRFIFAALFFMAILIGFVLTHVEKSNKKHAKIIICMIFLFLLIDFLFVNAALLTKAFPIEPQEPTITSFHTLYAENDEQNTQQYLSLLNNKGIYNCYERFFPAEQGAIPSATFSHQQFGNYHEEAYIAETNAEQEIIFWSPNKVIIKTTKPGTLILNQNYVTGWKTKVNNQNQETFSYNGAIATEVTEATSITFYYLPNAFIVGLLITILTIILSILYWRKNPTPHIAGNSMR